MAERVAKICLIVPDALPDPEPAIRLARRLRGHNRYRIANLREYSGMTKQQTETRPPKHKL